MPHATTSVSHWSPREVPHLWPLSPCAPSAKNVTNAKSEKSRRTVFLGGCISSELADVLARRMRGTCGRWRINLVCSCGMLLTQLQTKSWHMRTSQRLTVDDVTCHDAGSPCILLLRCQHSAFKVGSYQK